MGRSRKEQPVTPGGYLFLHQVAFKLDFEGWGVTGGRGLDGWLLETESKWWESGGFDARPTGL